MIYFHRNFGKHKFSEAEVIFAPYTKTSIRKYSRQTHKQIEILVHIQSLISEGIKNVESLDLKRYISRNKTFLTLSYLNNS